MKKVLSFVLVLALVLSSFSMAFAGEEIKTLSDINGNTNEEAIQVNYDLGIVTGNPDGTFQPEKAVTRAEFAAMITRGLAIPQSALAGYASTNFKDTNGYTWAVPYIAFCNSKGIMLGDGAGNAMPGKTITVNEAVTMVLRAIGYTANSAELTGVYPSNYVTKAQELKLYDDVAKDAAGVDKANAAQIIYNALTVQKVAVNSDGETKKLWDVEPTTKIDGTPTTLLTAGLNCTVKEGVIVGYDIDTDDSLINIAKYIGCYGDIYMNDDDEIVAFISDSDQLVGRFIDGDFVTFDDVSYNIKDSNTTIGAVMDINKSDNDNKTKIKDLNKADFTAAANEEYTINCDLTGKTIHEVYSAVKWTAGAADKAEKADIEDIADHELMGFDFIEDDNDDVDYTQFQLIGVNSIKDIKEDNVVYVYANKDKEIKRIEVGTEVTEGTVKSFKNTKDDKAATFNVGTKTVKNAEEVVNGVKDLNNGKSVKEDNASDDIKAYLDARGFVFTFDDVDKVGNYAVIEKLPGAAGIDDQVKLMLADGTEKVFNVDDSQDFATIKALGVGTLIGYSLDKNGLITKVEAKDTEKTEALASNTTNPAVTIKVNSNKLLTNTADSKSYKISSDVVVFTYEDVPGTDVAGKDYDITTIDKVDKWNSKDQDEMKAVLLFDDGEVVAMIIPDTNAESGDKVYAVASERNKTSNDDGDRVYEIVGFKGAEKLNALTDDDDLFAGWSAPAYKAGTGLKNITMYEITVDAAGVITKSTALADATDDVIIVGGANGEKVTDVDGRNSITTATGTYALASDVVIYEVDDNEYNVYRGSVKADDYVILINTDKTERSTYDYVIFARP